MDSAIDTLGNELLDWDLFAAKWNRKTHYIALKLKFFCLINVSETLTLQESNLFLLIPNIIDFALCFIASS